MTYLLFILRSAFEDFYRNKLRTLLTSLGILIGVASVVLLIALGLGLKAYIKQQFESLGTNTLYAMPGSMESMMRGGPGLSEIRLDDKDVKTLKKVKNVTAVVPFYSKVSKMQGTVDTKTFEIAATTSDAFDIMSLEIEYGSLFTKADVEKGSKKVVLGPKAAEKIFGSPENAVGKTVKVDGQAYKVVGVVKAKGGGGLGTPSVDEHVYMPHTAAGNNTSKKYMMIYMKAANEQVIPEIKRNALNALLKRYKKDEVSIVEQTEILNTVTSIFSILNSVLIGIAAISLVVGGVGIMNIMYVSVIERIREIGIRRAIGAKKTDILWQFLAEAVLLSGFGGVMGLLIAVVGVFGIRFIFPAYIDAVTVVIALGVSSGVGILFGVFPAKKAAELSPIEAIRYE